MVQLVDAAIASLMDSNIQAKFMAVFHWWLVVKELQARTNPK